MKKLIALIVLAAAATASAAKVSSVKVKALDRFGGDTGAVVSRCQTKVGETYDPTTVSRDVNSLKASNEFEEISADADHGENGVDVVFYVRRKVRFLKPLVIEGNEFFTASRVTKEAALTDGSLYGEGELADAAARVRAAYRKKDFADVKVTPRVDVVSGNDARITLVIVEGERRKVRSVVFEGAAHAVETSVINRNLNPFHSLEDGEFDAIVLHEAVQDYPWWNPVGWFLEGPLDPERRRAAVAAAYRDNGYLDVRVTGPKSVPTDDGRVDVVYKVDEGVRYLVGNVSIRGLKHYSEKDVASRSEIPERGSVASQKALDAAAQSIRIAVCSGDIGLADAHVQTKHIPSASGGATADIVFKVTEGVPVRINEVKIVGNDYTKDKVIRREIALGPGDRMLEDRAERSRKRLENLDYFSRVHYYLAATDLGKDANGAEYRDLVYQVEEKNTGSFMVGVGASSVDSVYVSAELNQNNFDLFAPSKLFRGGGQKGRAYVAWGPRYQSAEIGVVEPYFMNRMLELSVDAYRRMRWYDQYDLIRSGGMASLSYPVKFWPTWEPFGRLGVGISGEFIEFDDVERGTYYTKSGREVSFVDEERKYGDAFEPVLHLFWVKDGRDSFRIPTKGFRTRVSADVAPGGDNKYWKLGFNHRHYWTVWKRYGHVLMAGVRAETIDGISDDVPIYNRMFLGGPKSIRGIEYRHVSPHVRKDDSRHWEPWGGQTLFCANFEYTIPIVKMFRFAVFSDVGSVGEDEFDLDFSDTFAWTVGLGLRLDIPMFPIRLDFATPVEKPDHAEDEVFSFTIGYDF
ncbi:MAG: BamA/TamA family outer membrane protein [Kiritimatiellae bacterium]|nr:BamA/TamA family outer membrane protein [Kiritimatiellia bacterium]